MSTELIEKLERSSKSHKGENGKVLIIGGSRKYTGAPALAAEAALRAGADLVKILTAEEAKPVIQGFSENLIVESYGERFDDKSLEKAVELGKWADSTVIGPGLTDFDKSALEKFAEEAEKLVIDAEAIKALTETEANIFTPHSGEAEPIREKYGSEKAFTSQKGNTVVLKGRTDKIYAEGEVFENETGCAGMTVGGTGDVLAGVVASFKAQGLGDENAARLGAFVNGRAGEKAYERYGNGLVASDLIDLVAEVIKN